MIYYRRNILIQLTESSVGSIEHLIDIQSSGISIGLREDMRRNQ
jgi:hypothetical protein